MSVEMGLAGLRWVDVVGRRALSQPHDVALRYRGQSVTWRDLYRRAQAFSRVLAERGVVPGDRVMLLMRNRPQFVEAALGAHLAGAIAVPLNFRLAPEELAAVIHDCDAVAMVGDTTLIDSIRPLVESVMLTWSVEDDTAEITVEPSGIGDVRDRPRDGDPGPAEVAFILYTSGTTGRAKGAMVTHRGLLTAAMNFMYTLNTDSRDVYYLVQPLFHIGGLNGLIAQTYVGGVIVLSPSGDFGPEEFIRVCVDERVTTSVMVPTMAAAICELDPALLVGTRLRRLVWGASPATKELLQRLNAVLPGTQIISAFGQTESTGITSRLPAELAVSHLGSVGTPVPMVSIKVVDVNDEVVAPGEVGEILYHGPQVFAGYWRNPEATEQTFVGDWLRSGDLVRQDGDGNLYVVDRVKDMIISGGENIYSAEVESVLGGHPAVKAAAVVGVPHPKWGETPVAFVVPESSESLTEEELIQYCQRHLASYKKPTKIHFVDELPLNSSGKVLKTELRRQSRPPVT